jgi:hypothetical protein
MRIVEQTEYVLTLQNSSRDFWCEKIVLILGCPIYIALIFTVTDSSTGWFRVLFLFILLLGFFLGLQEAWSSNVVRLCSFNKALNRINIKFYGIEPITKNFSIGEMQALEVRETAQAHYGVIFKWSQLWLVTRSERFFLSDTRAEEIADRVREFLLPIDRPI